MREQLQREREKRVQTLGLDAARAQRPSVEEKAAAPIAGHAATMGTPEEEEEEEEKKQALEHKER